MEFLIWGEHGANKLERRALEISRECKAAEIVLGIWQRLERRPTKISRDHEAA